MRYSKQLSPLGESCLHQDHEKLQTLSAEVSWSHNIAIGVLPAFAKFPMFATTCV